MDIFLKTVYNDNDYDFHYKTDLISITTCLYNTNMCNTSIMHI